MSSPILIGTRGWDHDEWAGGFYPPELPHEWRFCLYSNNLRAVLVPGEVWAEVSPQEVRQWVEDCDPQFRFLLELPPEVSSPAPLRSLLAPLTGFFRTVAPIHHLVAGLVVRVAGGTPLEASWLDGLLTELGESHPLCADLPAEWRTAVTARVLTRHRAGLGWHVGRDPEPASGGRLLVARSGETDARAQRAAIEKLAAWRSDDALAGLFFEGPKAAEAAGRARLIAEMLGV
jgi:hypothetical protein